MSRLVMQRDDKQKLEAAEAVIAAILVATAVVEVAAVEAVVCA